MSVEIQAFESRHIARNSPVALEAIPFTEKSYAVITGPAEIALIPFARSNRKNYVSIRQKFAIANGAAIAWALGSLYLSQPWLDQLSTQIGITAALIIILGIAIIPGFMNAFLICSLALDRRPKEAYLPLHLPISILIAAYNEETNISETIDSIAKQGYKGELEVIVIDDGSTDSTAAIVSQQLADHPWLKLIVLEKNAGKGRALNHGLAKARYAIVLTIDADSCLYDGALQSLVTRYVKDPANTRMVAGTVLVRNSRASWIAKAQEWDYFHGISAIKRVQSLYQGTLVAQGAFSLYDRHTLIEAGGWPDCVGEDIVLTWAFLKAGHRVGHSEEACIFTNVPTTLKQFSRQRQRWSRGMIEAFKRHPGVLLKPRLSTVFIYWNLLFPLLDFIFTFCFIPGLILALFGHYWIAGPMTLALIPVAMAMNFMMFRIGKRTFTGKGLKVRTNIEGFLIYVVGYSLIMQPVCLAGYFAELINMKKSWGTK